MDTEENKSLTWGEHILLLKNPWDIADDLQTCWNMTTAMTLLVAAKSDDPFDQGNGFWVLSQLVTVIGEETYPILINGGIIRVIDFGLRHADYMIRHIASKIFKYMTEGAFNMCYELLVQGYHSDIVFRTQGEMVERNWDNFALLMHGIMNVIMDERVHFHKHYLKMHYIDLCEQVYDVIQPLYQFDICMSAYNKAELLSLFRLLSHGLRDIAGDGDQYGVCNKIYVKKCITLLTLMIEIYDHDVWDNVLAGVNDRIFWFEPAFSQRIFRDISVQFAINRNSKYQIQMLDYFIKFINWFPRGGDINRYFNKVISKWMLNTNVPMVFAQRWIPIHQRNKWLTSLAECVCVALEKGMQVPATDRCVVLMLQLLEIQNTNISNFAVRGLKAYMSTLSDLKQQNWLQRDLIDTIRDTIHDDDTYVLGELFNYFLFGM